MWNPLPQDAMGLGLDGLKNRIRVMEETSNTGYMLG